MLAANTELKSRFGGRSIAFLTLGLLLCWASAAQAIIINTITPSNAINSTAPGDDRGWQFVGAWGTSNGVAIGPHYFLTAQHIGGQTIGGTFTQNDGNSYTVLGWTDLAGSDLRVVQVSGTIANYAPLWDGGSEVGETASLIGRGRIRDQVVDEIASPANENGWNWLSSGTRTMSWGMNVIDGLIVVSGNHDIYFDFDKEGSAGAVSDEGVYSRNDSGGGLFIYNTIAGEWQLAGLAYAASDVYYTFNGSTYSQILDGAAIYDATNLYQDSSGTPASKTFGYAHQLSYQTYADFLAPYTVPEPLTVSLLGMGVAGLLRRRRRR